jgi:hypothetical protein
MTPEQLAAIRARADAATAGPWEWRDSLRFIFLGKSELITIRRFLHRGAVCAKGRCPGYKLDIVDYLTNPILRKIQCALKSNQAELDAQFIAHARADIPALLDHIERLQGQVEALAELVREAYQSGCSDAADYECGYGGGGKYKEILSDLTAILNGAGNESEGE